MATTIHSNGSKWAGEEPDSIETLLDVLDNYVLDRTMAPFFEDGRFFGNFTELSHVFSIDTDDPALIAELNSAIARNMDREDFRSQLTLDETIAKRDAAATERHRLRHEERKREARSILGMA